MAAQFTIGKSMVFLIANLTKVLLVLSGGLGIWNLGHHLVFILKDGGLRDFYLGRIDCLNCSLGRLNLGIQGDQRRRGIAGVSRIASLLNAAAEYGVVPVIPFNDIASAPALPGGRGNLLRGVR